MTVRKLSKIHEGQDGAIFGGFLFRLNAKGDCTVYCMEELVSKPNPAPLSIFSLDKREKICPHGNCVVFGSAYYTEKDEFPLLYANVYNTYANEEDERAGVCCVYRIFRKNGEFSTALLQTVEIDFTKKRGLWKSKTGEDVRPYGNFVIDRQKGKYYAFTMIDGEALTRYFEFALPKCDQGEYDPALGIKRVRLKEEDILSTFDCEYHHFIQGGVLHNGRVYSLEGFGGSSQKIPRLRIIDVEKKREIEEIDFAKLGIDTEPELIDFYENKCIYSDGCGDVYVIE